MTPEYILDMEPWKLKIVCEELTQIIKTEKQSGG